MFSRLFVAVSGVLWVFCTSPVEAASVPSCSDPIYFNHLKSEWRTRLGNQLDRWISALPAKYQGKVDVRVDREKYLDYFSPRLLDTFEGGFSEATLSNRCALRFTIDLPQEDGLHNLHLLTLSELYRNEILSFKFNGKIKPGYTVQFDFVDIAEDAFHKFEKETHLHSKTEFITALLEARLSTSGKIYWSFLEK